jgi:hypothetical protein
MTISTWWACLLVTQHINVYEIIGPLLLWIWSVSPHERGISSNRPPMEAILTGAVIFFWSTTDHSLSLIQQWPPTTTTSTRSRRRLWFSNGNNSDDSSDESDEETEEAEVSYSTPSRRSWWPSTVVASSSATMVTPPRWSQSHSPPECLPAVCAPTPTAVMTMTTTSGCR